MRGKPRPGGPPARHPAVRCGTGALAKSLTESRLLYLSDTIRQRPWQVRGEPCTVASSSSCVTLQLCGHFSLCDARSLHTVSPRLHASSDAARSALSDRQVAAQGAQVTESDLISFRPLSSGAATASARCAARLKGTTTLATVAPSIAM